MSDQTSSNTPGRNQKQYYCHQCRREIEPYMAPNLTCPHCNGDFVEEIEEENDPRFEQGGGHDADEEYDDVNVPFTTGNSAGGNELMQFLQNIVTYVQYQSGSNGPISTTETTTGNEQQPERGQQQQQPPQGQSQGQQQGQPQGQQGQPQGQQGRRPNFIFAMGGTSDEDRNTSFFSIAQLIQRVMENAGNNNAIFNLFNINGDPRDYAWGSTELDNIISQLMEQQAGRQAPPPASDEIIENLPKTKITKKQIEEQLSCPICKDEFKLDEEVLSLPCSHDFHGECIKPWLKVNGTCPVCRYSLVSRENSQGDDQSRNNGTGPSGNNNSNNNGSSTSTGFRFTFSSSSGVHPGNQSNNNQPNRQGNRDQPDQMDLDSEPLD